MKLYSLKPVKSIKRGETFATGIVRPKTTALFFDRLWVPGPLTSKSLRDKFPQFHVPADICIENPKGVLEYISGFSANYPAVRENLIVECIKNEFNLHQFSYDLMVFAARIKHSSTLYNKGSKKSVRYRDDHDLQSVDHIDYFTERVTTVNRNRVIKELVTEYKKEGIHLTPIYLTPTKYDEIKIVEEQEGVEICLDFIPDIVEEKLTWEQVLEFRKDKKAKMKLDRLRRWFKTDLLKKNEEEIKNILGQKLDDYQWALKKHGIQTVIGGSTSIMSFVSGPTLLKLLTESPLAMVSGGVAIGAGAIAWIGKKVIERTEIKRDPIAYIYEVRKLEK
jgi:hypothetical protein